MSLSAGTYIKNNKQLGLAAPAFPGAVLLEPGHLGYYSHGQRGGYVEEFRTVIDRLSRYKEKLWHSLFEAIKQIGTTATGLSLKMPGAQTLLV